MKNYLFQKTNMLKMLAIAISAFVAISNIAQAQQTQYWYIAKPNDNPNTGNSINGTSTMGLVPNSTVTNNEDFVESRWTQYGINNGVITYPGGWQATPHDKGAGLFLFGSWGGHIDQMWWSVSIYTKEELSKDIDSVKSIAINSVGRYAWNDAGGDLAMNEANDYAVFVYETDETSIRSGNSSNVTPPATCMYLPAISDGSADMNELYPPMQTTENAYIGPLTGFYFTNGAADANTYIQHWLDHNAHLIEHKEIAIKEFTDNAWIEFSTESAGRPGYKYKGGNLVVVMLQLRKTNPTSGTGYPNRGTMHTASPQYNYYIRNYGAEDRSWYSPRNVQWPDYGYKWNSTFTTSNKAQGGAGMFAARFGVTARANEATGAYPSENMFVVQKSPNFRPRVNYNNALEPGRNFYDVAKFSYKIVNEADEVVYQAKGGAGEHDTLLDAVVGTEYSEITRAVGKYARSDGHFVVNPEGLIEELPALGNYRTIITWQTFLAVGTASQGSYPTRQVETIEVPFTIALPVAAIANSHPTWGTPITLGQAIENRSQPGLVINNPQSDSYLPRVQYSIRKAIAGADGELTELGDIVYTAWNADNYDEIDVTAPVDVTTFRFTNATGTAANADGTFNADNLAPGKYYVGLVAAYPVMANASSSDINTLRYDSFWVAYPNELEFVGIVSPKTTDAASNGGVPNATAVGTEFTYPGSTDLRLEYTLKNWGARNCSTHVFIAEIYNQSGVLVSTIRDTSDIPIEYARSNVFVSKKSFNLPALDFYSLKCRVAFVDQLASEGEVNKADNVYPRENEYYPGSNAVPVKRWFRIQSSYSIGWGTQVQPVPANTYRYPCYPTVEITNNGSTDINGIDIRLVVLKPGPGPNYDTLIDETKPLSNIPIGGTTTSFSHNTLFFPDTVGTFVFKYYYDLPGATPIAPVTRNITVNGGLGEPGETTIYTIGNGGDYTTIREAMEELYYMGVQGHVVFEIDAELNAENRFEVDASYLDFRSEIVGAGPDATITIRPSSAMQSESQPIILSIDPDVYAGEANHTNGLRSDDWFGIAFGDASLTRIDVAAVNNVVEPFWRNRFAQSNGYITIDGGARKNFQIEYNGHFVDVNNNWLAAPVYLGAGSNNITIKNCRIPDMEANMRSSYEMPVIYYDDATANPSSFNGFRYEALSTDIANTANVHTTAGIFMFARPLDPIRIDNVVYTFNRNISSDNTIEGNVITGFAYGVFALGMGANVEADTIKPMYNKGTRVVDNLIKYSGHNGIFLGFEENAVVSGNRINNIVNSESDVAGIRLGQATAEQRVQDAEGYYSWKLDGIELNMNNYNVLVEKNEIDGVRALTGRSAFGILVTEPTDTLQYINRQYSPLAQIAASYNNGNNILQTATNEVYTITNNLIYNIVASGGIASTASRAGIAVLPSAAGQGILPDSVYDHTRHKVNKVLASNNTIILDDNVLSTGGPWDCSGLYVAGIKIFDAVSYEIVNNAIAIKIDTAYKYDYISGVALRSPNPKLSTANVNVNYNAYSIFEPIANSGYNDRSAFVRFFEVDKYGRMLSQGGFAEEYNKLRNWYSWTGSDKNSLEYNFINEVEAVGSQYFWTSEDGTTIRRMLPGSSNKISQLDKGCYLNYVATDIDGITRLQLGKYFNIGAIDFTTQHANYDVAVLAISQPVAYLNPNHTYSSEEQIMLASDRQSQDVQPRAIIKNNGTISLSNVPVVCTIETGETTPRFSISDTVWTILPIGVETEITFFTNVANRFTPQTYRESGVSLARIPEQYRSMLNNVSPVYTVKVSFDPAFSQRYGDANIKNDSLSIRTRFFAPRSAKSLLISAKWSYKELYAVSGGTYTGIETDLDVIAGRLNFDTVIAALSYIGYPAPAGESDPIYYDVLERTAWEPRAVVYDQYSGVLYSDALNDTIDYWEKKPLLDYAAGATVANKRTLIVGSEGLLSSNNHIETADPFDKELNDNVLRSANPFVILSEGALFIRGVGHNKNLDIELVNTGYFAIDENAGGAQIGDRNPAPHYFDLLDTVLGRNSISYYEKGTSNIVVMSGKLLERNVVHSAIDWRHLKNAGAFMEGIFGDVGNDINKPTDKLGIELADFNANANGKKVFVDWTTLSEGGIANFEVQRADVSNNLAGMFASIDSKRAKGIDNVTSNYNIFDDNVNYGQEYAYRLKINDVEGKYTYSPIKNVNIEYADGLKFSDITPNPVSNLANADFTLTKEANVIVTITDLSGKEVMTLFNSFAAAGTYPLTIDASKLATGTYTIVYNIGGNVVKTAMFNVAK